MFALSAATFLFNLIKSSITDSSDSLKRKNPHKSHFFYNTFHTKCSAPQGKSWEIKVCSYIRDIFICCDFYLLLSNQNRAVNLLSKSSRMEFELSSSHDPLLLMQDSQLLKAGFLTLQSNRLALYLFGSQSCCSEVMRQGLNLHWDRESSWCLSFGKRLTWRRSQHGLVGRETTVNSGPFSQLPAETNTNDYLAIVSIEATRHLWMFTKSFAPQRSLARWLWESTVPFTASYNFLISLCYLRAFNHNFIALCTYEQVQLFAFYLYQHLEKAVAAIDTDVFI